MVLLKKRGKKNQNATKQEFCHNQKTKVCFTWNTSFLMDDIPSVTSASSCYLIIPDKKNSISCINLTYFSFQNKWKDYGTLRLPTGLYHILSLSPGFHSFKWSYRKKTCKLLQFLKLVTWEGNINSKITTFTKIYISFDILDKLQVYHDYGGCNLQFF